MSRKLDVYLHDGLVGELSQNESGDLEFTYDQNYFEKASHGISIAFPVLKELSDEEPKNPANSIHQGKAVKAFFSGLLPEESVREHLAKHLGVSEKNSFALLKALGGDCAGALALYPQGEKPSKQKKEIERLDEKKLKEVLDLIKQRPMLAGEEGYRLSLAGAQNKLAVGFEKGSVLLIKGGAPTTHIIKPIITYVKDSAHNELFCMKLAESMGIQTPRVNLHFVGQTPYYLIERYDREVTKNGSVKRIHQEDFCQALGVVPEIKYEREGGPSLLDCQRLLTKHSAQPAADQIKLIDRVIFNYLIGNADAHAKNFSLLYTKNKPELAPAYDLLSTAIYPSLSTKMAMKIGGKYKPEDIYLRHFHRILADTKPAQSLMNQRIKKINQKIFDTAIKLKADLKKEDITSSVFDEILEIIKKRSKHLEPIKT